MMGFSLLAVHHELRVILVDWHGKSLGWPGCRGCIAETELPGFGLTNGSFGFLLYRK